MGFQAAVAEVWPSTHIQRCWFHKMGNVLDKMPEVFKEGKEDAPFSVWHNRKRHSRHMVFIENFRDKYPKAVECLSGQRRSLAFGFPSAH